MCGFESVGMSKNFGVGQLMLFASMNIFENSLRNFFIKKFKKKSGENFYPKRKS